MANFAHQKSKKGYFRPFPTPQTPFFGLSTPLACSKVRFDLKNGFFRVDLGSLPQPPATFGVLGSTSWVGDPENPLIQGHFWPLSPSETHFLAILTLWRAQKCDLTPKIEKSGSIWVVWPNLRQLFVYSNLRPFLGRLTRPQGRGP